MRAVQGAEPFDEAMQYAPLQLIVLSIDSYHPLLLLYSLSLHHYHDQFELYSYCRRFFQLPLCDVV